MILTRYMGGKPMSNIPMSNIEFRKKDGKVREVYINNKKMEILDGLSDDDYITIEADLNELENINAFDYPENLSIMVHDAEGFGTNLFLQLVIFKEENVFFFNFNCHEPNKYWEYKWGLSSFLKAVAEQVKYTENIELNKLDVTKDWKTLSLLVIPSSFSSQLMECINEAVKNLKTLIKETEISLEGMSWKEEYENDEKLFCTEVLSPLMKRMEFLSVRYTHGTEEYGKDFIFSELTPFGQMRYYGLQAKAGNVNGGINSEIDELIGQINDAFQMPYREIGSEPIYISTFIIAISGKFTKNAKEKIAKKMHKGLIGSVYFLDKEQIMELIEKYWKIKDKILFTV